MKIKKLIFLLLVAAAVIALAMVLWSSDKDKETGGAVTPTPTAEASVAPTMEPIVEPTQNVEPTPVPTAEPTKAPTSTPEPTATATPTPTEIPHEHTWVEKDMPATCTESGKTWEECECGEDRNELVREATGHGALTYTVETEPTVDKEGAYEEVCEICGAVVNKGSIDKLVPTPTPTATPVPTSTPTPTATPVPTSTPTPEPTATPTSEPTATPTPEPVQGTMFVVNGTESLENNANVTLTGTAPMQLTVFLEGTVKNLELECHVSDGGILSAEIIKGSRDREYTVKVQPRGISGKGKLILIMYGTNEYGERVECGEHIVNVKVEIPVITEAPYDPVADGFPYFVEKWTYEGVTVEVWTETPDSIFSALVITGDGVVELETIYGWTTYQKYERVKKAFFGEGITEIKYGLPVEYLEEVSLPTTLKVIGNGAFEGADITEVVIPEGVEVIDDGAFKWCKYLKKVTLPSTLKYIGMSAFAANTQSPNNASNGLMEIFIPKSVECIKYAAFEYRYGLVITVEAGTDTSGYSKEWNCSGSSVPHTVIYE